MRILCCILGASLATVLSVGPLAQAASGEDIKGSVAIKPLNWDLVITEFSVSVANGTALLFAPATATNSPGGRGAYGEKLQWLELQKLIASRGSWKEGSPAYDTTNPVLSG